MSDNIYEQLNKYFAEEFKIIKENEKRKIDLDSLSNVYDREIKLLEALDLEKETKQFVELEKLNNFKIEKEDFGLEL